MDVSNQTDPLTTEERDFAAALVGFFGAIEKLQETRRVLNVYGGDELKAFLAATPDDKQAEALAQWPMLQTMLSML